MFADSSNGQSGLNERQLPNWLLAVIAVIATIFLFFASQLISAAAVSIIPALRHWSAQKITDWLTQSVGAQFAFGFIADGLLIGGVLLILRWLRWNLKTIGLTRPKIRHILIGLVATVPYYILYVTLALSISHFVPALNLDQHQDIGFNSVHGALPLILTFASLVILPPLAEEVVMRGFLYTSLKRAMPIIVAALSVSALFGAAHLAEGGDAGPLWIGAIDTFTLSLVLVFLREKTGNLWAGIVLHAAKNCVAFATLFIIGGR